ncbi:MAG: RNA pseudouridine synthase, partial [Bacteroidota bacterium]
RLHYETVGKVGRRGLVSVQLETGRRHQIRVQLASIGCTIQGDVKYGKSEFNPDKSICLLAHQLTVSHPTKKTPITFTATPPENELWRPFKAFTG